MAKQCRDWNKGLAQDLREPDFAREFLLAALREGIPLRVALRKVILTLGLF
jgi:hypothetical protein